VTVLLDPTSEHQPALRVRSARPPLVSGRTVALLDISKPRGDIFLDRLEELLTARRVEVLRFRKPTFAKPAPADLRHEISVRCDAVVEALAD
jgi:hypothetical protein